MGEAGTLEIDLAPTYSGCPATLVIRASVVAALRAAGFEAVKVLEVLSPPWSSDWLSEQGRQKLKGYGIAPPAQSLASPRALSRAALTIVCPHCDSRNTCRVSEFGSTPCKALYRCNACLEPFEYFKCI
jgi:ring-1,2-phenylacetyl-CoA epoxidase subunit PaaD